MPVSRRTLALPLATVALLAACTSSPSPSPSSSAPADGAASVEPREESTPAWNTSPASVAAIGDSITRAFDACSALSDCPEASWATGTDAEVDSLAQRLLGDTADITGRSWNMAETGAVVSDLPGQARQAVAHEPELVTILIGANDACAPDLASMTGAEDFRAYLTEAMGVIRAELPEAEVYVSSVPDLMRLWSEGSGNAIARTIWQVADVCPALLDNAGDESADAAGRREAVRERVLEYNAALAEVCAEDELCRYDGGAVFDFAFSSHHLSDWDWFHPSREGQSTLAALAYERVTAEPNPAALP